MPSGARKRKAAKKKLLNNKLHQPNNSEFQSQGSDGGDVGREVVEETAVKIYDGESSFAETAKDVKSAECYNGDVSENHKNSSGSNSSSDEDEVDIETDKSVVESDGIVADVVLGESGVAAEVVEETVDETIPVEETVKEVVSSDPVSASVVDSELNQSLNEVSPPSHEKENVPFEGADLGQEKAEANGVHVLENRVGNSSVSANNTARDVGDKSGEKVQNSEEQQPLICSAPMPVQRTSWMNCCGLFEVISAGSGR